jgi:hypothetical protein
VDVSRAGQLFASIEEDLEDGIDVDVHLLSEAHPSSCIARDNSELTTDRKRITAAAGDARLLLMFDDALNPRELATQPFIRPTVPHSSNQKPPC